MKLSILITLSTALTLLFSGCGVSPKPKKELKVDRSLPVITLTPNGVFADMNAIAFEWKSFDNSAVKGINIYKQSKYYETINNRFATHYVDRNIEPNRVYKYRFKTFSADAESKSSKEIEVKSLDIIDSVTWIYRITGMPRSAKILWRPHTNEKVKSYIIQRKSVLDKEYKDIAKIEGRLNAEYIDKNLEDNAQYQYRIKVLTYDNIISKPSTSVKVITREIPNPIVNIRATKSLAKKITIKWNRSKSKYFERYHLYRSDSIDGNYKLIGKLYNNSFTDNIDIDGKEFFYRVSAVDSDGLESIYDEDTVMGKTISKPKTPKIITAKFFNKQIKIEWDNIDKRTVNYIVFRTEQEGWFDTTEKIFNDITTTTFIDKNIKVGNRYFYKVAAVDKDDVISKYSDSVEVKVLANKPIKKVVVQPMDDLEVVSESVETTENLESNER